ncbi:hypothetical protein ACFJGV_11500 [Cnuibacter sp. UC19_7]|uniref:hypothetical protein n=1 Tax=Cnuibacter sp. UC19_7 TaxID=3350166 RepID=UPI0036701B41
MSLVAPVVGVVPGSVVAAFDAGWVGIWSRGVWSSAPVGCCMVCPRISCLLE